MCHREITRLFSVRHHITCMNPHLAYKAKLPDIHIDKKGYRRRTEMGVGVRDPPGTASESGMERSQSVS